MSSFARPTKMQRFTCQRTSIKKAGAAGHAKVSGRAGLRSDESPSHAGLPFTSSSHVFKIHSTDRVGECKGIASVRRLAEPGRDGELPFEALRRSRFCAAFDGTRTSHAKPTRASARISQ